MQDLGIISPSLEEFRERAVTHRVIPVCIKILADSLTPIGIYRSLVLHDGAADPGTFLLESAKIATEGESAASSRSTLTTRDGKIYWQGQTPAGAPTEGDPVEAIDQTLRMLHTEPVPGLPPLTSGLVGYLGWDVVRRWENLPYPPADDVNLPEFALNMVSDMAIHDNTDGTVLLIANAINFNGTDENVDDAYVDAVERLHRMLQQLEQGASETASVLTGVSEVNDRIHREVTQTWSVQGYQDAIDRCKKNIIDGDVFQIVISRRFEVETGADALDVYRVLRQSNPSPYMYLFNFEDAEGIPFQIVGSSPEALVTLKEGRATSHPIAGSRPRGATREQDIAQFSAYDVLRVAFPAGTLSGAPKPRAMQLIDEYEPTRRGVYGGVCGYFDFAGNMDMAIAIRTAVLKGTKAYVQAGAGIVMDSNPESETEETVNKSAAPLRAVLTASGLKPLQTKRVTTAD